jgi:hypothetical protein
MTMGSSALFLLSLPETAEIASLRLRISNNFKVMPEATVAALKG